MDNETKLVEEDLPILIDIDQTLQDIASELKADRPIQPVSVRTLLSWVFAQRRGHYVVSQIRNALRRAGLTTEPDFAGAFIDGLVKFVLLPEAESETPPHGPEIEVVSEVEFTDPTFRIGRLSAANRPPVTVKPDSDLKEATTKMMLGDYSQLPVMTTEREVKGVITWASIGAKFAAGSGGTLAKDFLESHHEIRADASVFSAIALIVRHGYVLVRSADNRISGIVTAADLSLQFQQLSEPFLLLSEIENYIRLLISRSFGSADLRAAKEPSDLARDIESVSDLTFGEYIRLIENDKGWAKLNVPIDRKVFCDGLERVRAIRNNVMHFDPDGVEPKDLEALRDFARFLQSLKSYQII
jgi:CBS domain-containing protein